MLWCSSYFYEGNGPRLNEKSKCVPTCDDDANKAVMSISSLLFKKSQPG